MEPPASKAGCARWPRRPGRAEGQRQDDSARGVGEAPRARRDFARTRQAATGLSSPERRNLGQDRSCGSPNLVTVDGSEQLSWRRWRRLRRASRRAAGLVVTTHVSGRLPVLRRHSTDLGLLRDLVGDLVGPREAGRLEPELERLFTLHRGDLRMCLRSLYDLWAMSENPAAIRMSNCSASPAELDIPPAQ